MDVNQKIEFESLIKEYIIKNMTFSVSAEYGGYIDFNVCLDNECVYSNSIQVITNHY